MKFIADNIKELSRKNKERNIKRSIRNKERNIKRSIRMVRNRIKMKAKDGDNMCTFVFYETFNDNQQKVISDYFTRKGFKIVWRLNDEIVVRWV